MLIVFRNLLILFPLLILFGCATAPNKLGISEAEWNSYDKTKQEKLLADYKNLTTTEMMADTNMNNQYTSVKKSTYNGSLIKVRVFGGEAMLPPFTSWQPYVSSTFEVIPGTCVNAPLRAVNGKEDSAVDLRACYKNNVLLLDPSRYDASKKEGTIRLPYSPLWNNGFTYHGIYTTGYVRLKNAAVSVLNKRNST